MKKLLSLTQLLLLSVLVLGFVACDDDDDIIDDDNQNVIEFLEDDEDFSLLVEAADKANLSDALANSSPITLFAPTDAALQTYLDAEGTNTIDNTSADVLANILTNHVISGDFEADELETGYYSTISSVPVEAGVSSLMYVNTDGDVTINGEVKLMSTDNEVSNGELHTIGQVITPPTVVTFVAADPNFDMLQEALTRTDLTTDFLELLSGEGPFTVFAPTNEAFEALIDSDDSWNSINDIPVAVLEKALMYHVTDAANVRASEITNGLIVSTLAEDEEFIINIFGNTAQIEGDANTATIIGTNIQAENGVIHVIDAVLLPDEL